MNLDEKYFTIIYAFLERYSNDLMIELVDGILDCQAKCNTLIKIVNR